MKFFPQRWPPWFSYLCAGLLCALIGLHFRLYPFTHYASTDSYEKATVLVINRLHSTVESDILRNHPSLPGLAQAQAIKKNFDELLHREGPSMQKAIERLAVQIERQEPSRQKVPYLLEADPYNYLNLTQNIIETGAISDTIKGSKYLNRLMLAPLGHYEPLNLHPYFGDLLYRIFLRFNPQTPLILALSFTPVILTLFALWPYFLIAQRLRISPLISAIGGIFFLTPPIFIRRSLFGWYDNDPYNILFPLLILAAVLTGLSAAQTKSKLRWSTITAGLISLYALFWQGWMYLFCVVFVSAVLNLIFEYLLQEKSLAASELRACGLLLIVVFLGVAASFGPKDFFVLFKEGLKALKDFVQPSLSPWPDLYVSVGELHRATGGELLELTGGILPFGLAVIGLILQILKVWQNPHQPKLGQVILLTIFFVSSLLLTLGAQRFALLFLIPMNFFLLLGLQDLSAEAFQWIQTLFPFLRHRPLILKIFSGAIALGLLLWPIKQAAQATPGLVTRIYNQTWEKALLTIRSQTPPTTIVNSWWPPGHFIKAIAHRRVTFDGATINVPQAYWMANVFLAQDERQALGILRMLNDSANLACDFLLEQGMKLSQAVDLLKVITGLNRGQAQAFLKDHLPAPTITRLLELTHAAPPASCLFIYNELVEKSLVLSFLDRWDFRKVEAINQNPEALAKIPSRKSPQYINFLWMLAGGPLLCSEELAEEAHRGSLVLFEKGLQVNLLTMEARVDSNKFGHGIVQNLFYVEGEDFREKKQTGSTLGYSVLLIQKENHYSAFILDERLARSLLFRLFYCDGKGLHYFRPLAKEKDLTRRTQILVFAIDWAKFLDDIEDSSPAP